VTGKEEFGKFKTVEELLKRTNIEKPKAADVAELRRLLRENPRMWKWAGDAARRATDHVIKTYGGNSVFAIESRQQGVEVMRREHGYAEASPLERMLIEQIVICWFRLNDLELLCASKHYESHTTETGLYWDRRLSTAQRRFTRAVESLEKIRTLAAGRLLLEARREAETARGGHRNNLHALNAKAS